jgi:Fungal specific transcription factor domain
MHGASSAMQPDLNLAGTAEPVKRRASLWSRVGASQLERPKICHAKIANVARYERASRHEARAQTPQSKIITPPASRFLSSPLESVDESRAHDATDELQSSSNQAAVPQPPDARPHESDDAAESDSSDAPEMLFARMADTQPLQTSPSNFQQDDHSTFYLGEAFSLTFVVKTVCSPSGNDAETIKVHYPIPPLVDGKFESRTASPTHLAPEVMTFLEAQGAFVMPETEVSDALISTFFRCIHPAWPVFDRRNFITRYRQGQLSMLVLQTVFNLAVSVCDEQVVKRIGFPSRAHARYIYYLRAKALYDADYEQDKTQLTAVLFLLCFWWQKPQDQKDTWHWLGCAISLAQTIGMHRSTVHSDLSQQTRSLWKRIWWSIYVRERHAAAALGRPFRIRDDDCDVEPLHDVDFEADVVSDSTLICAQEKFHVAYSMEMSKLAVLLSRIITNRYSPKSKNNRGQSQTLSADLQRWENDLAPEMLRQQVTRSLDAAFWACLLHANYHNCRILLHRPRCVTASSDIDAESDAQARSAANATTRIAEDLLTMGTLRQAQVHLVPALFAALGIHAIVIRRKDPIQTQLAENRSRQCMLALSELAKSWPVGGWILRLFMTLMKRLTGRDFAFEVSSNYRKISSTAAPRGSRPVHEESISEQRLQGQDFEPGSGLQLQDFGDNLQATASQQNDEFLSSLPWDKDDQALLSFDSIFQQSLAGFLPFSFENVGTHDMYQ